MIKSKGNYDLIVNEKITETKGDLGWD